MGGERRNKGDEEMKGRGKGSATFEREVGS